MFDVNVHHMSLPDASWRPALLYAFKSFVTMPGTWKRPGSSRRDLGGVPRPVPEAQGRMVSPNILNVSAWQRQWASLSWSRFAIWYSEGAEDLRRKLRAGLRRRLPRVLEMHAPSTTRVSSSRTSSPSTTRALPAFATGNPHLHWSSTSTTRRCSTTRTSRSSPATASTRSCRAPRAPLHWTALYLMARSRSISTGSGTDAVLRRQGQ